ncbi:CCA tRNA nucleotidyltransferase [Adlercreutzia sp. ZJ473]|uniref:CCA tRNA nucleotidyltransferase n=1 Tax=Adlercreutzia sp. ZJ473 TaxID=2722822 RepID=UPI0020A6D0AA|nr:HD domain-containing protein [Adlercreutzia sp. ZJ473]
MNASPTPAIRLSDFAMTLIDALEEEGHEAWCVGGYVRDALLGRPCNDVDIATDALWPEVRRICAARGMRVYETGTKHGTVTVVVPSATGASEGRADDARGLISADGHSSPDEGAARNAFVAGAPRNPPDTRREAGHAVEVTTFRCDGSYLDARHPQQVRFVSTIEEDLARRDFTMNALAYHPRRGLVDPFGGIDDLRAGIIRVVGEAEKRFAEDALRTLRACRFCSQLGFRIDEGTYRAMLSHKSLLAKVSTERITHELDALLLGAHVHDALMGTVDVLSFALPELAAMKGCAQMTKYHVYDVLEHTAYAVQNMPPTRLGRWAALCHDMGKPAAAFFDESGVEHFYGHAKVSEALAGALMDRLLMGGAFKHQVMMLVRHHDDEIRLDNRAIRRMLMRLDGDPALFRTLCDLKRADALAQAPAFGRGRVGEIEELRRMLDALLDAEEVPSTRNLALSGRDVMELGVEQGPDVGRILAALLEAVVDEQVENAREPLLELAHTMI